MLSEAYCIKCGKVLPGKIFIKNNAYCEACIPVVKAYSISHDIDSYSKVLDMRVCDLECKHIMQVDDSCKDIYIYSIKAGFLNIQWGCFRENVSKETENATIEKMIKDGFLKPIRITVTDNHVWADNTHTAISYVRRYGDFVTVKDIPFYICDLTTNPPTIAAEAANIWFDENCISGAIRNAMRLEYLEKNGGRKLNWTIFDLEKQLF